MINQFDLPDECQIVIVKKLNFRRCHQPSDILCTKKYFNSEWIGFCSACCFIEKYKYQNSFVIGYCFIVLIDGEKNILMNTDQNLTDIIGNEIGTFHFIRKYIDGYPYYEESKFLL